MITNDSKCTREMKSKIFMAKAALNKKKTLFTGKLNLINAFYSYSTNRRT